MKRRAFTLLELLLVIATVIITAAILAPVFRRGHYPAHRASCQSNLKQIGLGMMQCMQDHGETFPLVAMSNTPTPLDFAPFELRQNYGWADALHPYIKSREVFQCPRQETFGQDDARKAEYTDYWMNLRLSDLSVAKISDTTWTILGGDGNAGKGGTDARYNKTRLPKAWLSDSTSPARRHLDTMNFLFADGHVKAFNPTKMTARRKRNSSPIW